MNKDNEKLKDWYYISKLVKITLNESTKEITDKIEHSTQNYLDKYGEPFSYAVFPMLQDDDLGI